MKLSDTLKSVEVAGFQRTGVYRDDVARFCREKHLETNNPYAVGLRLAFWDTITVHALTAGVCQKVLHTKIETMPEERPAFIQKPFLLEAKDEVLFDDVSAIGGYIDNGILIIISVFVSGMFIVSKEENSYKGLSLNEINFSDSARMPHEYQKNGRKVLSFITILSLMMEAERTPIAIDGGTKKSRKQTGKASGSGAQWIERRIYIDSRYQSRSKSDEPIHLNQEGKVKREVFIQGFLRHQPYGPKNSLRKWIYVEGFESSRWAREGHTRIIVDEKGYSTP